MVTGYQLCKDPALTVGGLLKIVSAAGHVTSALYAKTQSSVLWDAADTFDKITKQVAAYGLDENAYAQQVLPKTRADRPNAAETSLADVCAAIYNVESAYANRDVFVVSAEILSSWAAYQRALGNSAVPTAPLVPSAPRLPVANHPAQPVPVTPVKPAHHAVLYAFGGVLALGVAIFGLRAIFGRRRA